jgi:hypothetical protein
VVFDHYYCEANWQRDKQNVGLANSIPDDMNDIISLQNIPVNCVLHSEKRNPYFICNVSSSDEELNLYFETVFPSDVSVSFRHNEMTSGATTFKNKRF